MKRTARGVRAATVLSIIIALVIGVRLLSATEYTTARANANDLSLPAVADDDAVPAFEPPGGP